MTPLEIFNQKWGLVENKIDRYLIEENYVFKNGKTADIGITINNRCIAYGLYFPKLEKADSIDSRYYFSKYAEEYFQFENDFAFYFDEQSIIINDLKLNYPADEFLDDISKLYERISKSTKSFEIFKYNFLKIRDTVHNFELHENYMLKNGMIVDLAIIADNNCIAYGRFLSKLELSKKKEFLNEQNIYDLSYFKSNTESDFEFYFDDHFIVMKELKINNASYELIADYNNFIDRLINK